jgi:hypothetical protein
VTPFFDSIAQWVAGHQTILTWLAALSAVAFVGSLLALPWLVARIPQDYFAPGTAHRMPWADRHPAIRLAFTVGKNLLGVAFVLAGVMMLVLPGQGVLTIVVGAVLADFPGKHALLRRVVAQPPVLASANWLRRRAGQPPLIVD